MGLLEKAGKISDEDKKKGVIINLAWHLPNEVRANLKLNNYIGEVIDIKDMLF